jgi:hypothetical protein
LRRPETLPNRLKWQGSAGSKMSFQIGGSSRYITPHF